MVFADVSFSFSEDGFAGMFLFLLFEDGFVGVLLFVMVM